MRRNNERKNDQIKYRFFFRVQPCLVISLLINHVTNAGIQVDCLQFFFNTLPQKELHLFTFSTSSYYKLIINNQ